MTRCNLLGVHSEAAKKQAAKADKPKGARSSYIIWLADNREALKEEFPDLNVLSPTLLAYCGEGPLPS